jgi:selenide, water dikinase
MTEPRLTTLVQGGGCARKLPIESLLQVLKNLPQLAHPWVDTSTGPFDDAAIVRPEGASRSMVLTMDIITPMVDDPRAFGAIAGTNALSDVYAMGGRAEVALSFAGFPTDKLPLEVLTEILAGMQDACGRARCAIVGGHTICDSEPKAGLAVVGSVDPGRVWSQRSARAGQVLVLTKALGTGIVGQAIRAGSAPEALVRTAIAQMTALNDVACAVGLELGATSCTDVTGFGLLGHLRNLVEASDLTAEIRAGAVPRLDGVIELVRAGLVPGGSKRNLTYASQVTDFAAALDDATRLLLADAQTSGGLLLCLPEEQGAEAVRRLVEGGAPRSAVIGVLRAPEAGARIRVLP